MPGPDRNHTDVLVMFTLFQEGKKGFRKPCEGPQRLCFYMGISAAAMGPSVGMWHAEVGTGRELEQFQLSLYVQW